MTNQNIPPKRTKNSFKNPKRGEVWIIDLGTPLGSEQGGKRPAIMLNTPRRKEKTVLISPSSKTIRPNSVALDNFQFLCPQTRAVDRCRLIGKIKRLTEDETNLVANTISTLIKSEA